MGPTRSVAHPKQQVHETWPDVWRLHYIHSIAPMISRRSVCLPCYICDILYLIVYLPWTPTSCILFLIQRSLKASEGQRPQTVAIECFFWMSAFANHKRYAGQCHRTWAAWSDVCLLEWMYLEYPQRYPKASTDLQVLFGLVFGFLRSLGEGCCFIVCVPQYYGTSVIYTWQS